MKSSQLAIAAACLAVAIYAQCTGNDHPTCASWIINGFCTNANYTTEMKKNYCGVQCGLCNLDGTQTAAGGGASLVSCTDRNANCASWAAGGFCTNTTFSNAYKLLFCCNTCRASLTTTVAPAVAGGR